jgi:uncharacterized protein (DUF3084 family)
VDRAREEERNAVIDALLKEREERERLQEEKRAKRKAKMAAKDKQLAENLALMQKMNQRLEALQPLTHALQPPVVSSAPSLNNPSELHNVSGVSTTNSG